LIFFQINFTNRDFFCQKFEREKLSFVIFLKVCRKLKKKTVYILIKNNLSIP